MRIRGLACVVPRTLPVGTGGLVSYSDILARNHANDFLRVVNDPLYRATLPTMWLERDTDREIATTKRGKRIATSIDGCSPGSGET
jgi:hypothetical protein